MNNLLSITVVLACAASAAPADTVRVVTGPDGRSVTAERTIDANGDVLVSRETGTGRVSEFVVRRSHDTETGTYLREGVRQTLRRQTITRSGEVICLDRTCTRETNATGPRGGVATGAGTTTFERGAADTTVTRVGPRGGEGTVTRTWRRVHR